MVPNLEIIADIVLPDSKISIERVKPFPSTQNILVIEELSNVLTENRIGTHLGVINSTLKTMCLLNLELACRQVGWLVVVLVGEMNVNSGPPPSHATTAYALASVSPRLSSPLPSNFPPSPSRQSSSAPPTVSLAWRAWRAWPEWGSSSCLPHCREARFHDYSHGLSQSSPFSTATSSTNTSQSTTPPPKRRRKVGFLSLGGEFVVS